MKARGEILKQVQDDGVITVTRFVTVPHKCSAGSPRKKTFSSKDPEQKLASESLQKPKIRLQGIPNVIELSANEF